MTLLRGLSSETYRRYSTPRTLLFHACVTGTALIEDICGLAVVVSGRFSRAAARAHSTLRCTALPHGPLRMAYLLFGSLWASCSHLVLSHSPQFASFFFVHLPLRFCLTPRITQCVPIPFQHRARAVNPYPIIRFKPMSFFHYFPYITNPFTSSFTPSIDRLSRVIKRDEPKGSIPLAYFISGSLIVLLDRALMLKDCTSYYTQSVGTKDSPVFKQSRRLQIISVVFASFRLVCKRPRLLDPSLLIAFLASTSSHHRYHRRARFTRHLYHPFIALVRRCKDCGVVCWG